jgi:isoamylase
MLETFNQLRSLGRSFSGEPSRALPGGAATNPLPTTGKSSPIGATVVANGVNFCVFSRYATAIELLLFDREDDPQAARAIQIDPIYNRTYHYWHILIPDIRPGQLYGYRATGPFDPTKGLRFDPKKVLLDPYGRGVVVPQHYSREAAAHEEDNAPTAMKSVVVDPSTYDWEGDAPPRRPSAQTVIYEMHVRGFTRHPSSDLPETTRGTFKGLIEKIPYLQALGITAVELLPVFQFDAHACPPGLVNYWGYQPVSFFAPHQAYSSRQDPTGPLDEFRDMVKALHRAGIEVILDVVFNHTAEGASDGPTFCFRGLDNSAYYILDQDPSRYADYSGCGNTLNANHPVVRRMIVDSLHYWVEQMHVDGFRFDLASILARDSSGHVLPNPPVLWDIETDPVLSGTKLIAEAWDAAGLYQVGSFIGDAWKEWNGRFRDDARSFFRGDPGSLRRFADRLVGSPEIYRHKQREPEQSVNFVTCHDGFTLNDLVSYNQKHNQANAEENRDGCNENLGWNCGAEGPTDDPAVESLRNRQVKNFLAATMLSVGLPMIVMGDEVRRTQCGNNNAYCLDDETSWFDWTLIQKHSDVHRFAALLIGQRALRSVEHERHRLTLSHIIQNANKAWHGTRLDHPDWSDSSHAFALTVELRGAKVFIHLIFNAHHQALDFELPKLGAAPGNPWRRWIDTALASPGDISRPHDAPPVYGEICHAEARSVVVLITNSERTLS